MQRTEGSRHDRRRRVCRSRQREGLAQTRLRGIATGIIAADTLSIIGSYQPSHPPTPLNITVGVLITYFLATWTFFEILFAYLLGRMTAGNTPLISVNRDGVFIKTVGYRPCRIPWEEVKSIYLGNAFAFRLHEWRNLQSVVVVPHHSASLYRHLTVRERRWAFGSASLSVPQRAGWIGVSGIVMEIAPDEFMRRLNDYDQKYAWRPGLPGGPGPLPSAIGAEPNPLLSVTPAAENVEQSRDVCSRMRVLNTERTQRRALHRIGHNRAGNRRRMPNQYRAERLPAMLNQETQTKPDSKTAAPVASDTDTRVTPDELTAAIEAIERRKAAAQKRMAETIPVDQAVRELGIDATPEELLAEVRAQRAARTGGKFAPGPAMPPASGAPQAPFTKESFEKFIQDFVKESGLDALPDEIIAHLRARRLARAQEPGSAVVQSVGANARFSNKRARRGIGIGVGAFLFFAWCTGGWQHAPFAPSSHDAPTGSGPISTTLAAIPDNHPFTSDTASLQEMAEGKPEKTITVIDNEDMDDNHDWTVFKKSGHYYIKAFLPARVSQEALKTAPITIYNDHGDTPGDSEVKVTVQIDGTKVVALHEDGEDSTITLSNVHLDDNSYKW